MSKDPFANYFIQKLCRYIDDGKIKRIIEIISSNILDIGANTHGTRVVQQIINHLNTKELLHMFLNMILPYIVPLLKELNGTHIIQKLLIDYPGCGDTINKIIIDNSTSLAVHRHGCCVLQKFLDGPHKKLKNGLITKLIEDCHILIIDQFGNYVIQSILLLNDKSAAQRIAFKIISNITYYSKHRYSSNVVEKCFDSCGEEEKKKFIELLSRHEIIEDLIFDEHGNYVIQKALYYANKKTKDHMLNCIISLIPRIKQISFGEKLLIKLYSYYPQLSPNYSNNDSKMLNNSEKNVNN